MFLKWTQSLPLTFLSRFVSLVLLLTLSGNHLAPVLSPVVQDAQAPDQDAAVLLTSDQAIAVALNNLELIVDGYRLQHPQYTATFTSQGLTFTPKHGGPMWAWGVTALKAGDKPLAGALVGAVTPQHTDSATVTYARAVLVEQYLMLGRSIEQQFVIPQPLNLDGADLVIEGTVQSKGQFAQAEDGWRWFTAAGSVHLGDVRVIDAAGQELPASMTVTADATCIMIDGPALAWATYPVTIDPEIGTNDMRLSDMGQIDISYYARSPAVAYNSTDNEYLVVWQGSDNNSSGQAASESEIYGQRVDAATGAEVGTNDFRLSDMGPDGNIGYSAVSPAVAYNSTDHEYLVVWRGDDDTAPLSDNEYEIFGQRVDADGVEIGANDFRLSDMGTDGSTIYTASSPLVAYNGIDNEYLVVWSGTDNTGGLNSGYEIYGQRVDGPSGAEMGTNDFRLSDMGPDGDPNHAAVSPAVAYNSANNEYLVVWSGDDATVGEYEIFGQRVDGPSGAEIGGDLRLSDMGTNGDAEYDAFNPAVAYNSADNEYLVAWRGDDNTGGLVNGEFEVYGQRVNAATGAEVGTNDFRLSDMGADGNSDYGADFPAVAYNSTNNEYLVVWEGNDGPPLAPLEYESYGQRVDAATGGEIGSDFRLSDMGPDGDPIYDGYAPVVAYGNTDNEYLVVWYGDDNTPPLVDGEDETFGQRVDAATGAQVGANDFRLSDMGTDWDYDAYSPAVAYNSVNNEYLVVWSGDDNENGLADNEYEIYGQRVDAVTGAEIGSDFRLSDMGPDGESDYDAKSPAVAYSSAGNEYLVVWEGHDRNPSIILSEYEIYAQRVDAATGFEIGGDFRISSMGPDWNSDYHAFDPAVAYNSTNNEYLVVWSGDDDTAPLVEGESEIFGQRVDAATGAAVGEDDFRLSDMGPDGNIGRGAYEPAVAYNSTANEYLVVWMGDDTATEEYEIYGQRVNAATGAEVGTNDFRLSQMGPDGNGDYDAFDPAVAYNSTDNEYLVVWSGDNDKLLAGEKNEIYAQRVDAATGAEVGRDDFRLSDMGPGEDYEYDAYSPAVTYNSAANEYLVVWQGDNDFFPWIDNEYEIYAQRVDAATGAEVGENDICLSDMGHEGDERFDAYDPAVAYDSAHNTFLVVWWGDDDTNGMVNDEFEIFGQMFSNPQTTYDIYLPLAIR